MAVPDLGTAGAPGTGKAARASPTSGAWMAAGSSERSRGRARATRRGPASWARCTSGGRLADPRGFGQPMDPLHVPLGLWAATIAVLAAVVAADLTLSGRRPRRPSLREAALWTLGVTALAVVFGGVLAVAADAPAAGQFFAGWLTEYSLSLDNLFVFVLLIGRSSVPREQHGRVLLLGIIIALILRGIFIALGAAALSRFGWVLYLFGAFLLVTAARMAFSRGPGGPGAGPSAPLRAIRRVIPVSPAAADGRLTTRIGGRRYATPMLVL